MFVKNKLVIPFLFLSLLLKAQSDVLPLNFEKQYVFEKALLNSDKAYFSTHRPFLFSDLNNIIDVDSLAYQSGRDAKILNKLKHPLLWQKLRVDDLIHYKKSNFEIKINPLMNFSTSSYEDRLLSINTRGVELKGRIGKQLSFVSGFYENQGFFIDYYNDFVKERRVVPGQGRYRIYDETGFDYADAYGSISYSPFKNLNIQMGHGKQFIGEGYRSLIISDYALNVPFLKITSTYKWLRYTNLLMLYQNVRTADGTTEIYNRKYGSITSLDVLLGKRLEIGLIETIVWNKKNNDSYLPDANLYNPIILIRPLQYGWSGNNNVALGLNAKLKISKSILAYSQYLYDDNNRNAFQIGVKSYRIAQFPLFMQVEYNRVMPYTYSHYNQQTFTHANQELAHPLGANFTEYISRIKYQWKDVIITYQLNYSEVGLDSIGTNYGQNIFLDYQMPYGNEMHQGEHSTITNHSLRIAYLLNPISNLQIYFQYRTRKLSNNQQNTNISFWTLGLKTNIRNLYDDF
jgi:hypothetical protein